MSRPERARGLLLAAAGAVALAGVEDDLADADRGRGDLDALIFAAELKRLLQRQPARRDQFFEQIRAGGVLKPGDEVMVLPSGMTSRIAGIDVFDQEVDEAFPPMSVTVRLEDNLDVSRGDMICRVNNRPEAEQDIDAMVCWMTNEPLTVGRKFTIKHTTKTAKAIVREVAYRLDINTLHRDLEAGGLHLNDIGRIRLHTAAPLLVDPYSRNRTTGSFILIDDATGNTVGAGMING